METQNTEIKKFIEYEVANSWIAKYISWTWLQEIMGSYYAWVVRRKYNAYKEYLAQKAFVQAVKNDPEFFKNL